MTLPPPEESVTAAKMKKIALEAVATTIVDVLEDIVATAKGAELKIRTRNLKPLERDYLISLGYRVDIKDGWWWVLWD